LNPAQGFVYDVWKESVKYDYPIPETGLTVGYPVPGGVDWTFINPEPKKKTFFEKQLRQQKTENKNKQETKYKRKYKRLYTCGRGTPNVKKQETKYNTAAHGKHVRQFTSN
jgi:hypothetical protein